MNVFSIPDSIAHKYHGCGHALAASANGELIDLIYVEDVVPEFDPGRGFNRNFLTDQRLGPTVRGLQALGTVHVGMCSCWEFCEL